MEVDVQDTSVQDVFLEQFEDESEDTSADQNEVAEEHEERQDETDDQQKEKSDQQETQPDDESTKHEITVNGEKVYLTDDEFKIAAQKGMDYDRIRSDRERLKAEHAKIIDAAKSANMDVTEFINTALASINAVREEEAVQAYIDQGYDEDVARKFAEKDALIEANAQPKEKEETPKQTETLSQEDIDRFVSIRPNVDAKSIPDSVWESVRNGSSLTEAYLFYELEQKDAELKAAQKNNENKERSSGSAKTSKTQQEDAFLAELMRE